MYRIFSLKRCLSNLILSVEALKHFVQGVHSLRLSTCIRIIHGYLRLDMKTSSSVARDLTEQTTVYLL